jgi:hypothetical protein
MVLHISTRQGREGAIVGTYAEAYVGVEQSVMDAFAILRAFELTLPLAPTRLKIRSSNNAVRTAFKVRHASGCRPALLFAARARTQLL